MDAESALADLVDVSREITAAALVDDNGNVLAATLADERAAAFGAALHALLGAAETAKPGDPGALTQLRTELRDRWLFVVRHEELVAAASTGARPAAALVEYDLRACLRALTGVEADAPA